MTWLTTGISAFSTVFVSIVDMIKDNVALTIFVVAGFIISAFKVFKRGKKAVL